MAPRGKKHARHVVPDVGLPRDAKRMQRMLESMDVKRFEPNVAQQLLELMHRTIAETLEDAVQYSEHAGRGEVSVEDTRLALAMVSRTGDVRRRPPPGLLREMAAVCNRRNLPEQRKQKQLPPPRDTFIHDGHLRNWQVVVPHRVLRQAVPMYTPAPPPPAPAGADARGRRTAAPQIPIRLGAVRAQAAAPAAQPANAEPATLNLQDALALMQDPAVDYDDDMWDAEK